MQNITLRSNVIYGNDSKTNRDVDRTLILINCVLRTLDRDGILAVLDLWADTTDGDKRIAGNITCSDDYFKEVIAYCIGPYVKFPEE